MDRLLFKLPDFDVLHKVYLYGDHSVKTDIDLLKQKDIIKTPDDERMYAILKICHYAANSRDKKNHYLLRAILINYADAYENNEDTQMAFVILPEAFRMFGQKLDELALSISKEYVLDKKFREEITKDDSWWNSFHSSFLPDEKFSIVDVVDSFDDCLKKASIFDDLHFQRDFFLGKAEEFRQEKLKSIACKMKNSPEEEQEELKQEYAFFSVTPHDHIAIEMCKPPKPEEPDIKR